jgi:hypothetical protein
MSLARGLVRMFHSEEHSTAAAGLRQCEKEVKRAVGPFAHGGCLVGLVAA